MEMYGISDAIMHANSLHGQIALNEEKASLDYQSKLTDFNNKIRDRQKEDSSDTEFDVAKDLPDLNDGIQSGKGVYGGVKGAAGGARDAYNLARSGVAASTATSQSTPLTEAAQSSFLAESSAAAEGVEEGAAAGAGIARSAASGVGGAATGFVSGLREVGGEASGISGDLQGVEGIVQNLTTVAGGGGEAAKVFGTFAGKATGAAGGIISAVGQISSLAESGGKSMFDRTDTATGKLVRESGASEASGFLNEAGAAADIAAAASGGLLVPFAAALNLAGAITGVIGEYEDQKSDDRSAGLGPDGKPLAGSKPTAPGSTLQTEAFTSLGFVGNMSHNPLDHIA